MKKKKKGGEEDEKKKWWKSRFNLIGQSVESRRLRSRRAFLDHHRPCSSITRRRRRRGGVRCRRRDAQWSCRPRLFEQYASTRRDDTDPDRALSRRSSSAREFRSKSFVHVTLNTRLFIIFVRRDVFLPVHELLQWTSLCSGFGGKRCGQQVDSCLRAGIEGIEKVRGDI